MPVNVWLCGWFISFYILFNVLFRSHVSVIATILLIYKGFHLLHLYKLADLNESQKSHCKESYCHFSSTTRILYSFNSFVQTQLSEGLFKLNNWHLQFTGWCSLHWFTSLKFDKQTNKRNNTNSKDYCHQHVPRSGWQPLMSQKTHSAPWIFIMLLECIVVIPPLTDVHSLNWRPWRHIVRNSDTFNN